ncbi:AMP-binding protein [Methylocapsa sp. S129]|uniref:AMP-binding protein n=1 Tax=Methylocapsa sp. S129 TaxID=1641869 RepID=UPI00131EC1B9|nr:AMP-binding protein [Methylocapsa sp. S129]
MSLSPTASLTSALNRLIETARRDPRSVALRHKHRGAWDAWSWYSIVVAVDRFASGLRRHGVEAGSVAAFAGEISPNFLLGALAARAIGAAVISIAPGAKTPEIAAVLRGLPVRVAIVQGREALAEWIQAGTAAGKSIPIVFDHVTPEGRSPHPSVLPIANLRDHAAEQGWAETLGAPSASSRRKPTLWIEATTAWADGLNIIADLWLASGETLALPELLAASARDRFEIRPDRWIASSEQLTATSAEIAGRLPPNGGLAGRIVARAIGSTSRSASTAARFVKSLLRYRLGLSRLNLVEVGDDHRRTEQWEEAEYLFAALGAPLRRIASENYETETADSAPANAIGHLALSGDAR